MKDSDWGIWYMDDPVNTWADPDSLDIFSTSDTWLTMYAMDFCFDYTIIQKTFVFFKLGIGFLYQFFDYSVSDLDQWYPSYEKYAAYIPSGYSNHVYVSGEILTYRVEYYIPYIKISPVVRINEKLLFDFSLSLSPCTSAKDLDDHILRYKLSEGRALGMAVISTLGITYQFNRYISAGLLFNMLIIYTKANQEKTQYEFYDA